MMTQNNPGLSFAVQESIPLKGTYPDALPLGPLMELGAGDPQNDFTPERAAQSLQYWQTTAQQVLADPETSSSTTALKSYSHDAVAAANLLAAHNFTGEAEQAYQVASQLWPENPASVSGLADLLVGAGRESDARQLLESFAQQYPGQQKDLQRTSAAWRLLVSTQPATR
jgi:thioredoxin-like negative regulator of GroEL